MQFRTARYTMRALQIIRSWHMIVLRGIRVGDSMKFRYSCAGHYYQGAEFGDKKHSNCLAIRDWLKKNGQEVGRISPVLEQLADELTLEKLTDELTLEKLTDELNSMASELVSPQLESVDTQLVSIA